MGAWCWVCLLAAAFLGLPLLMSFIPTTRPDFASAGSAWVPGHVGMTLRQDPVAEEVTFPSSFG